MILPAPSPKRQIAAGLSAACAMDLTQGSQQGSLLGRARASDFECAFVCKNRFWDRCPSPSRRPDPQKRVRSRFLRVFRQAVADPVPLTTLPLAPRRQSPIYVARGCGTGQKGGRIICRRHLHSQRWLRFSHLPRAATPTLSAAYRARPSGPSLLKCLAETFLQGPPLAVPPAFYATILRRKLAGNLNQILTYRRPSGHHAPAAVVVLAIRQTAKEGPCSRKS